MKQHWTKKLIWIFFFTIIIIVLVPIGGKLDFYTSTTEKKRAATNLALSKKFFEKNQKKTDIITLPEGVQYKILKEGKGKSPGMNDFARVDYRGILIDGTEFDSSERRNAPTMFEMDAVIPGLAKALHLMKPGAEWIIYIPPELAYGEQGIKGKIPSNMGLIFEIRLISVSSAPDERVTGVLEELQEKE